MALGFELSIRNALLTQIVTQAGANAKLRFYGGSRPAMTAAPGTALLSELICAATLGTVSAGVLTFNAIAQDAGADATGVTTWFRIVKSDGTTHVMDGLVTATGGGGDITLSSTTLSVGVPVSITNFASITAANNT